MRATPLVWLIWIKAHSLQTGIGHAEADWGKRRLARVLVQSFEQPDEVEAAHRNASASIVPTGRGDYAAQLVRVMFDKLEISSVYESAPRIRHVQQIAKRCFFKFPAMPGYALVSGGMAVPYGSIVRHARAEEYYERSTGSLHWGIMSWPHEGIAELGIALAGVDLAAPRSPLVVTPAPGALSRLMRLYAAATTLSIDSPDVVASEIAARSLEQTLAEALIGCVLDQRKDEDRAAVRSHQTIMRRFHRILEANAGEPLYVPDVCVAIGVSERTLRSCCQEHLDMGPKQFLLLRRIHLAHRALIASDSVETTVTDIATQFGFWQFGRFASAYRVIFGEPPSATLRRPMGRGGQSGSRMTENVI
ncbi:MAG TPA: helix-turn-helix domain-containing protein [Acetobacteraceae bacterium]|nr:helix-turn-helix domain-containing protein [Acetobacteraceae bacterium]